MSDIYAIAFWLLLIWTVALSVASWYLGCMFRSLVEERRELRRWKRLQGIFDSQRARWQ